MHILIEITSNQFNFYEQLFHLDCFTFLCRPTGTILHAYISRSAVLGLS